MFVHLTDYRTSVESHVEWNLGAAWSTATPASTFVLSLVGTFLLLVLLARVRSFRLPRLALFLFLLILFLASFLLAGGAVHNPSKTSGRLIVRGPVLRFSFVFWIRYCPNVRFIDLEILNSHSGWFGWVHVDESVIMVL